MNESQPLIESGRDGPAPIFSICIPQYNRTSFLIKAIQAYASQSFRDFEICISDGGSTDGRQQEIIEALRRTGIPFVFRFSPVNLQYDPNTRTAIGLARGRYCLLMGNDDALNGSEMLADLWKDMQEQGYPGVVLNDACEDSTNVRHGRINETANRGAGPRVAAMHYRNFSFVSGVVLEREPVQAMATEKWDGSEMYQTYVGCRLIASGRPLLERNVAMVRKDLVVPGETVDAMTRRPRIWPCPIIERTLPFGKFSRLVCDAIAPYAGAKAKRLNEAVLFQQLGITMPYWLFEYRNVQSWRYAVGIALGLQPSRTASGVPLGWRRLRVWFVYIMAAAGGLILPHSWFDALRGRLYRLAKSIR